MRRLIDNKKAKVHTRHDERVVGRFLIDDTAYDIINTKHSVYRVLEKKRMDINDLQKIILAIGKKELDRHFTIARKHYNKDAHWHKSIDYVLSIYDIKNEIVLMIGLHPHLNRITIVTVIPRINDVASNNVYGTYRIDTEETKKKYIEYIIPKGIEMQLVVI